MAILEAKEDPENIAYLMPKTKHLERLEELVEKTDCAKKMDKDYAVNQVLLLVKSKTK